MLRRLLSAFSKAPNETPLSAVDFSRLYGAYLKRMAPDCRFESAGELQLRVSFGEKGSHTVFLDNAYSQYLAHPERRDEILEVYIGSLLEALQEETHKIDAERIVPVIKDRGWLEGVKESLLARGADAESLPDYVSENYNSELAIFFAEDNERNIRYLTEDAFEELQIDRETLRERAIANLRRLVPQIEVMGEGGTYMITAGGDYEASLILIDSVWEDGRMEVDGEILVAIPARDLLIVSGTGNPEAIERLRQVASEGNAQFAYNLSPVLFVRRNGVFEVFEG